MKRHRVLWVAVLGCTSTACMKQYAQPTAGEPHAIVKFRRHYDSTPGASLGERLVIGGDRGFASTIPSSQASVARTDALLVHPGSVELELDAAFSHQESYTTTQSYSCGTTDSPRRCTRTVTQQRTVVDGRCRKVMGVRFDAGKNYLLQLDYQDARNCSARCMVQEPLGNGEFKNSPCVTFVIED